MKIVPAVLISTTVLLLACGKDKFDTTPRIEIKSYNSRDIHQGEQLTIRLNYFDKEGDLGKGDFWAARYRANIKPLGTSDPDRADTLDAARGYQLPDFDNKNKGEIFLQVGYADFLKESNSENDTIYFRIAVADRAGNKSDTITTEKIVVYLP